MKKCYLPGWLCGDYPACKPLYPEKMWIFPTTKVSSISLKLNYVAKQCCIMCCTKELWSTTPWRWFINTFVKISICKTLYTSSNTKSCVKWILINSNKNDRKFALSNSLPRGVRNQMKLSQLVVNSWKIYFRCTRCKFQAIRHAKSGSYLIFCV